MGPGFVAANARNYEYEALISATGATAGTASTDLDNPALRGVKVAINISAISGTTPTLTVTIEGKDPISGSYYSLLASSALSATGTTVLTIYPGIAVTANKSANDVLPSVWRVSTVIGGTTPSVDYTVGAVGLV